MRLAEYSRDCLRLLREETNIQYEQRSAGTVQLFRTREQFDAARRDIVVLEKLGVAYELLDARQLAGAEPALERVHYKLTGGLRLPNDETGDCHLFTQQLAAAAKRKGVRFLFDSPVESLETRANRVVGVRIAQEVVAADAYVVACGSHSRSLLAPLGIDIPVYPVKGYSLTLPIVDASSSPVSTVLDETYKIAITRFDDRVRVGGMAELAGFDLGLSSRRRETLEMVTEDLFPGATARDPGAFWTGLRPMTPDSTPIVGSSTYDNLFINTGHGTLGWTMACGSGQLVADLATGNRPAIRTEGLDLSRYRAVRTVPEPFGSGTQDAA